MKNIAIRNICNAAFLAVIIQVIGCVENVRHYAFARLADESTRVINHYQHDTEQCKLFTRIS